MKFFEVDSWQDLGVWIRGNVGFIVALAVLVMIAYATSFGWALVCAAICGAINGIRLRILDRRAK